MMKLIPYPLAEPVSSKEDWEAAIKEKRQTDQRGRGKRGPLSATFLIPVLWLCHCGCSAQEAHPLPAASPFLLRRQIHTQRNQARKAQRTQDFNGAGRGGERGITQDATGVLNKDLDTPAYS